MRSKTKRILQSILFLPFLLGVFYNGHSQSMQIKRIWNKAPHSAFTGLVYYEGEFYCSFREAKKHVDKSGNDNGVIRILKFENGKKWKTFDVVKKEGLDLRDAMLSITPDGRLMLLMGGSVHKDNATLSICSHVAFASKETLFSEPTPIQTNYESARKWLWKIKWLNDTAYGFIYGEKFCFVKSCDGIFYETISEFSIQGSPNETDLSFNEDGQVTAIIRRARNINGLIGISNPPYVEWEWTDCAYELGGPDILQIANDKKIISSRYISSKGNRVLIFRLKEDYTLSPILLLPSGGDCSYSDAVLINGIIYMSYYSSHRRKSSIYFAIIPEDKLEFEEITLE